MAFRSFAKTMAAPERASSARTSPKFRPSMVDFRTVLTPARMAAYQFELALLSP